MSCFLNKKKITDNKPHSSVISDQKQKQFHEGFWDDFQNKSQVLAQKAEARSDIESVCFDQSDLSIWLVNAAKFFLRILLWPFHILYLY